MFGEVSEVASRKSRVIINAVSLEILSNECRKKMEPLPSTVELISTGSLTAQSYVCSQTTYLSVVTVVFSWLGVEVTVVPRHVSWTWVCSSDREPASPAREPLTGVVVLGSSGTISRN